MSVKSILCSIPVETGGKLRRKDLKDHLIMPKIAITRSIIGQKKMVFQNVSFMTDMLYPDDNDIRDFFQKNQADIVGLSAVVSTSYLQVERISRIIKEVSPGTIIVCGGYLTAAANTVLHKTDVDICVVGDGEIAWVGLLNYKKK